MPAMHSQLQHDGGRTILQIGISHMQLMVRSIFFSSVPAHREGGREQPPLLHLIISASSLDINWLPSDGFMRQNNNH
jgi:hypothetical protein